MTKKIHERVLLDNGQFGDFPERHIDKAVELGKREPLEKSADEPLLPHGVQGKNELESKRKKAIKPKI